MPTACTPTEPMRRLPPGSTGGASASGVPCSPASTARAAPDGARDEVRAAARPLTTPERILPISVATIVAVASLLAVLPATPQGAVGGTRGPGHRRPPRGQRWRRRRVRSPTSSDDDYAADRRPASTAATSPSGRSRCPTSSTPSPQAEESTVDPGPVLDDGTLLTGYAPATEVEDGADLIEHYKVKSGDTLVEIAHHFDVSMMTLWWANKLKSKDDLHIGQVLRIPPVSGLVYTVKDTDTLDSLAGKYKVSAGAHHRAQRPRGPDPRRRPGARPAGRQGRPDPDAQADPQARDRPARRTPTRQRRIRAGQVHYTGGQFHWPVVGGGNYISQYFHYGHEAIDIAADYGSHVVAAAGGRVTFAGWKSNGGGYQVWISHGGGLYTTYNHMSAITVGSRPERRPRPAGRARRRRAATRPVRTSTSRSGSAPSGTAARASTRCATSRRRSASAGVAADPVRQWPQCSSMTSGSPCVPVPAATARRRSAARPTSRGAAPTAATAGAAARSTCGSTSARRRSATSATSTTSARRRAGAASARAGTARRARTCSSPSRRARASSTPRPAR